jgi:hypothetical protein
MIREIAFVASAAWLLSIETIAAESSRDKITEAAQKEAAKHGHDAGFDEISIDDDTRYWTDHLSSLSLNNNSEQTRAHAGHLLAKLKQKQYQVVRFTPKRSMLGGSLYVFVDAETADILGILGEK